MRIVVAPDSFKESLSAADAAAAIASGVRDALPDADVICVPMADGGEGSLAAVLSATGGQRRELPVQDALGRSRMAGWALLPDGRAFIEMAEAAGLEWVALADRDPLRATTYGVGQLIAAALDAGARHIVLSLGGSATNDGGAGALTALGVRLLDAQGHSLPPGGLALRDLARLDTSRLDPRLASARIELAVDVDNPLCGPRGASAIFGPQKGATPEQVQALDAALAQFADVCARELGHDRRDQPGMGAAGGVGFGLAAVSPTAFGPGATLIAELAGLPQALSGASLVFTGEGRLDSQTLAGKTPAGVARYAQAQGIPVIALAGSLGPGYEALYEAGITAAFSLVSGPTSLAEACDQGAALLRQRAGDCVRLWLAGRS